MLTLVNTNRMTPPIAPIGLDYVAAAAEDAGIEVRLIDLALAGDPADALSAGLAEAPRLVGLTFRNVDDCFWPSGAWFVPDLRDAVSAVRERTDAPIVLGGVGYSLLADRILSACGADFGIRGDGESAIVALYRALAGRGGLDDVPGLVRRGEGGTILANRPAWPDALSVPARRAHVDNARYFRTGGQGGVETKRGCDRLCAYCADPLAKGPRVRTRSPVEVAGEIECLLAQGVDVLHLCDGEFNVPADHAKAVCTEMIARGLGERVRWYAYLLPVPFDEELAGLMRRAGCAGIDFTTDSACPELLAAYGHGYAPEAIAAAVRRAKGAGLAVMLDLLFGGPGETPDTVRRSVAFFRGLPCHAVGCGVGVRVYPGTPMAALLADASAPSSGGLRRHYEGAVDLLRPTFYVSPALGDRPAALVRDAIGGDERFFPPCDEIAPTGDHNYNENRDLLDAIAAGARGAYWDILRR